MVKQFLKERLGTIILFALAIIFVIWGFFSIEEARSNAITFEEEYTEPEGNVDFTLEGQYVSIAKTDALELLFNEAKGTIQVKDLESGHLWKGACDNEVYDLDSANAQWKAYMQSSITMSYSDLKKRDSGIKKLYSARDAKIMEHEFIENGVSVTYGFTTPAIYVTVEYILDGDQFLVRVPYDKIREEYKFAVTMVEVLPFFGAAGNDETGYLFYPDGSGAITSFENVGLRPSNVKSAFYYTYTNKTVTFKNLWNEEDYNRYTAAMPVFGIKNGDNAMFAACTEGGENIGIAVGPSGYVVDLNRVGFEVNLRNVYSVNMYNMSTSSGVNATGSTVQRVDKALIPETKEIRYFFLNGDDADYSGMASVYRQYLIENGLMKDAIVSGETMPLALKLLMGTTKEGMVFDEYITMTDFEQVQEILERLNALGVTNTEVVLQAWMKGYDDWEYWGPASQLGGTGGLESLSEYLANAANNDVYLETSMMFASSDTNGLEEDVDVAYDGLDLEVSMENMDGIMLYMLNPLAAYKRNQDLLDKLSDYEALGVGYEDVGMYAYADFNINAPYTKGEAADQLRELLADTKNANRHVASAGANQYVYSYSDYMYGLREDSFGLSITDNSVPFVQLVLSGSVPYSTEGAGNLAYDLQTQKLKWIEYGALPYFYLTYESALNLRDTEHDTLFSSTYDDWESTVVETYKEFKDNLSIVYGQQIVDHEIITTDLRRIEYANGVVIYVNYANESAVADGVTIPAKNYVVVGGGEQ